MTTKKVVHVSGKRKNSKLLQLYSPKLARMRIMEPLLMAGNDVMNKIKIDVDIKGGGWNGQAEAARLAIARGLVQFTGNKQLEKDFLSYDRHLLVADIRQRETRKPNTHQKARSKVQKSYR